MCLSHMRHLVVFHHSTFFLYGAVWGVHQSYFRGWDLMEKCEHMANLFQSMCFIAVHKRKEICKVSMPTCQLWITVTSAFIHLFSWSLPANVRDVLQTFLCHVGFLLGNLVGLWHLCFSTNYKTGYISFFWVVEEIGKKKQTSKIRNWVKTKWKISNSFLVKIWRRKINK